jgi:hypothetical protein
MHRRVAPHHTFVLATAILGQLGCGAGWRRVPSDRGALDPRQQVQVWTGGEARQLHGVTLQEDSLSGIPFTRPLDCVACREEFPLSLVDSIRVGNPVGGFWKTMGLVLGGALVVAFSSCAASQGCGPSEN